MLKKALNYHDQKTNLLHKPKVIDKRGPVTTEWFIKAQQKKFVPTETSTHTIVRV